MPLHTVAIVTRALLAAGSTTQDEVDRAAELREMTRAAVAPATSAELSQAI
jgi:hypothetical protein